MLQGYSQQMNSSQVFFKDFDVRSQNNFSQVHLPMAVFYIIFVVCEEIRQGLSMFWKNAMCFSLILENIYISNH